MGVTVTAELAGQIDLLERELAVDAVNLQDLAEDKELAVEYQVSMERLAKQTRGRLALAVGLRERVKELADQEVWRSREMDRLRHESYREGWKARQLAEEKARVEGHYCVAEGDVPRGP